MVLCLSELRQWVAEGKDGALRHRAGDRAAACVSRALGLFAEELSEHVGQPGGEEMAPYYNESFHQIDELSHQLLMLVETARSSAFQGEGGMLAYGWISECASKIKIAAEGQRQMIARAQLENTLKEELLYLEGAAWRRGA